MYRSTGIEGLDKVLGGGIAEGSVVVVEGAPGTGKTTLGIQFLHAGAVEYGEPGIYVTFEELPDQIYADMAALGWDLRALEREGKLRIVCLSPDILLEQMKAPDSVLARMIEAMSCKRIVLDSISLLHYAEIAESEHRRVVYGLRNTLRKWGLTSLLLRELKHRDEPVPFENFIADGVIRLALSPHQEKYRKRTIEVLKMRNSAILEGEHLYRITDKGIRLIPALTMIEDKFAAKSGAHRTPTGIKKLDELLYGGLPDGAAFLLDTNSKANFKYIVSSIFAERLKAGNKLISLNSSMSTVSDFVRAMQAFGVDAERKIAEGETFFIEHYGRPTAPEHAHAVIDVTHADNEEYRRIVRAKVKEPAWAGTKRGEKWFMYYDLNTVFSQRGADFVRRYFAEEISRARANDITVLALCNFAEIDDEVASFLERTSNGVIRTWVDGNYQYLQLTKSPDGNVSEPMVVYNTDAAPYIDMI